MGRTVKISELQVFDVYHDVLMNDGQKYMYLGDRWFCLLNRPQETFRFLKGDYLNCDAELLGRMIFQEDRVSELLAEKKYKEECEDFVNNGP